MATNSICKIEGCGKASRARGWCGKHWRRWKTHGDPLAIKYPTPARDYYEREVLTYEGDECLTWPFSRTTAGYGDMNGQYVHRMVCEKVNGPPPTPKHQAAHSCGHGHLACVTKRHLEWKTPARNAADKLLHGTHHRGERHGQAKLTEAQVRAIRSLAGTMLQKEIAERFGIHSSYVGQIQRRDCWGWLD